MKKYLESSKYIDWENPAIIQKAKELAKDEINATVKSCFEFVRDEINHSMDFNQNPVTVKASDVLRYKTGFCYAKSHLLAALLRANNIPIGLCYQRLTINDDGTGDKFCLHGLNSVYLEKYGWYRIDPRGNKANISAEFTPPIEKLAFKLQVLGEIDFPEIYSEPLSIVTDVLEKYDNYLDVANNLPDIKPQNILKD